jgi:hypothetical protein
MTTVAFKDGFVAADSLASSRGWNLPNPMKKVFNVPVEHGGGVIAMTGVTFKALKAIEQIVEFGKSTVNLADGEDVARLIHFRLNRIVRIYEGDYWFDEDVIDFGAWGSGSPVAWGALAAGATAEEAVKIASRFDPDTGGDVQSYRVF